MSAPQWYFVLLGLTILTVICTCKCCFIYWKVNVSHACILVFQFLSKYRHTSSIVLIFMIGQCAFNRVHNQDRNNIILASTNEHPCLWA